MAVFFFENTFKNRIFSTLAEWVFLICNILLRIFILIRLFFHCALGNYYGGGNGHHLISPTLSQKEITLRYNRSGSNDHHAATFRDPVARRAVPPTGHNGSPHSSLPQRYNTLLTRDVLRRKVSSGLVRGGVILRAIYFRLSDQCRKGGVERGDCRPGR